jgi:hypothetical protein
MPGPADDAVSRENPPGEPPRNTSILPFRLTPYRRRLPQTGGKPRYYSKPHPASQSHRLRKTSRGLPDARQVARASPVSSDHRLGEGGRDRLRRAKAGCRLNSAWQAITRSRTSFRSASSS